MNGLKIRTREQQYLAIPLIGGILSGLVGLVLLFSIPADPKNSLIFGFSTFRLLEGLGILAGTGIFAGILFRNLRDPDFSQQLVRMLGWHQDTPWSLAIAWFGLFTIIFLAEFGAMVFPGQIQFFERLGPLFIWLSFFSLTYAIVIMVWVRKSLLGTVSLFLVKINLIILAAGVAAGLVIFPAIIGMMLRQGSLLILLILSPVLYFAFEKKGIQGFVFCLLFLFVLFFGALIGVWASGSSDLNIVAGLLPYNDANGYYHGGRLLAEGQPMHPFSSKRPLFPALLGVFYWTTGENLQFTLGCLIMLVLLAIFFTGREIKNIAGSTAAAFLVLGLFLFLRRFIGSTMSEMLGLPLGAIGFALLWSSAARQRLADAAAGILLLCLGLLSRAGPFFMLPLLIIWAGWGFQREGRYNWKAVAITAAAAGLGYMIHLVIFTFLAGDNSSSMANFSYSLYGLVVGGKGWKQYIIDHPDVLKLVEPYQSRAIYLYAFEAFKANPFSIVQGAIRYWQAFFTMEWYGAFGYIEGVSATETQIARWLMAALSAAGVFTAVKKIKKPEYSMILAGVIGIVLSVPFVPTLDAEIRTYAAGIPWFIGIAMLGLRWFQSLVGHDKPDQPVNPSLRVPYGLWAMSAVMVILVFIAPLLMHLIIYPTSIPTVSACRDDEIRVVTTISRGSYINVMADTDRTQSFVPDLRYTDFNISMHNSPVFSLVRQMFPVKIGYSFFTGYNWVDRRFEDILGKTDLFTANQGWVELCGWRETDSTEYGFFHAETARKINR